MNHRFESSSKSHQLVARARQFSSFIMIVGNMADASTLEPKDAIIVLNKVCDRCVACINFLHLEYSHRYNHIISQDEVLIPLLLEELPTAKEFKDAVKSLSPEQQRFARAYRSMQLASSVFGVCIIQIKPQLEALLGLPADALDKEMKLTQDLMELFVEYQIPSDLLSYNGLHGNTVALQDMLSNVKDNVKGVMDVINSEKEKQLKSEQAKTEMAVEKAVQSAVGTGMRGMDAPAIQQRRKMMKISEPQLFGAAPTFLYKTSIYGNMSVDARANDGFDDDFVSCPINSPGVTASKSYSNVDEIDDLMNQLEFEDDSLLMDPGATMNETASNKTFKQTHPTTPASNQQGVDFTLTPKILDASIELNGEGNALRSTTMKTGQNWVRNRRENLLSIRTTQKLSSDDIKAEKNKAFDLLDALSRSGSLPIAYSDLHVVVAVTHCFDKDVMSTVVCDNVNPIEKLERSTLLLASAVHGVPARELIGDVNELHRLEKSMQFLIEPAKEATAEDS